MGGLGGLMGLSIVVSVVDRLSRPIAGMRTQLKGLQNQLEMVDRASRAMKQGLAVVAVGAAAIVGLAAGAEAAGRFETSITRLGLVSQASAEELGMLRSKALELGVLTEWSPEEAAAGMQALASSGYNVRQQLAAIEPVLNFASAGIGDLATAAKLTDSVLKAWQMGVEQASEATDKLTRLTQIAAVEMNELAPAVPVVAAAGSAANQSVSEALAVLGAIRPAAQSTQDAAQIFNSFAEALKAPTLELQKMVQKNFGLDLNKLYRDANGNLLPMTDIIDNLAEATAGMSKQQRDLFLKMSLGQVGAKAFDAALKAGYETMVDGQRVVLHGTEGIRAMRRELDNSGGTTAKFAAEMQETWDGIKKMLSGTLQTFAIVLGLGPLQVLSALLKRITALLNPVLAWAQRHERLVKVVGGGITVFVLLGTLLGALYLGLALATMATLKFSAAAKVFGGASALAKRGILGLAGAVKQFSLALLTNPVFLVIAGLAALGVALVILYRKWGAFRSLIDNLVPRFKSFWAGLKVGFSVVAQAVAESFKPIIAAGKRFITWIGSLFGVMDEFHGSTSGWITVGIKMGKILGGVVAVGLAIIIAKMAILTAVMLANPIAWIVLGIVAAVALVVLVVKNWGRITGWLMEKWEAVKGFFAGLWSWLVDTIKTYGVYIAEAILIAFTGPFGAVAVLVYENWDKIKAFTASLIDAVVTFFTSLPDRIGGLASSILEAVKGWFAGVPDFISELVDMIVSGFLDLPGRIGGLFKSAGKSLLGALGIGIKESDQAPARAVQQSLQGVDDLLPHSDAKMGPLANLTSAGRAIPETMAKGLRAAAPTLSSATLETVAGVDLSPLTERAKNPRPDSQVDLPGLVAALRQVETNGRERVRPGGQADDGPGTIQIHNLTIKADLENLKDMESFMDLLRGLAEGV